MLMEHNLRKVAAQAKKQHAKVMAQIVKKTDSIKTDKRVTKPFARLQRVLLQAKSVFDRLRALFDREMKKTHDQATKDAYSVGLEMGSEDDGAFYHIFVYVYFP